MREGWLGNDHLILFTSHEAAAALLRYQFAEFLPGFTILGLRGWDDFIVRDAAGKTYITPTVPMGTEYLKEYSVPADPPLQRDPRSEGKIKWYLKPIVFGGDPKVGDNVQWVTHDQHGELVVWWNATYRKHKASGA